MDRKRDDSDLITRFFATQNHQLREEIIMRYTPLVHYVLGRLGITQSMGADYEDAASQGLLGLIEAVDHYDLQYGTQFSTYATLRIRGKVIDYLRSLDWLSRNARKRARLVQQGMNELLGKLQRAPSDEELADFLGLDLHQVQQALVDSSRIFISLDSPVSPPHDNVGALQETLPDERQADPATVIEEVQTKNVLVENIKKLSQREQLILSLYYYDELTFKEIGAVLGISESRVCQLHGRIITKIKAMMTNYYHQVERDERVPPLKKDRRKTNTVPGDQTKIAKNDPAPAFATPGRR